MPSVTLTVDAGLVSILQNLNLPADQAAQELMVLELYRRGTISSGKAAQILDMSRWEFVRYASRLGIPFFDMSDEEWEAERQQVEDL